MGTTDLGARCAAKPCVMCQMICMFLVVYLPALLQTKKKNRSLFGSLIAFIIGCTTLLEHFFFTVRCCRYYFPANVDNETTTLVPTVWGTKLCFLAGLTPVRRPRHRWFSFFVFLWSNLFTCAPRFEESQRRTPTLPPSQALWAPTRGPKTCVGAMDNANENRTCSGKRDPQNRKIAAWAASPGEWIPYFTQDTTPRVWSISSNSACFLEKKKTMYA